MKVDTKKLLKYRLLFRDLRNGETFVFKDTVYSKTNGLGFNLHLGVLKDFANDDPVGKVNLQLVPDKGKEG